MSRSQNIRWIKLRCQYPLFQHKLNLGSKICHFDSLLNCTANDKRSHSSLSHTVNSPEAAVSQRPVTLTPQRPKRIVVGITGATGTVYAIRLLSILRDLGIETHLIISKWALATLKYETALSELEIRRVAHVSYTAKDLSAPVASGSFQHDGMIIIPCSMKTLAAVKSGFCDDLISRAADVTLKEERKLVMVVRETPLSVVHLENMLSLRRAGAVIFPPVPAFYTRPQSLDDVVMQSVGRILDSVGIHIDGFERWNGFRKNDGG
ncbi:hypothetical protein ACHAQJ_009933 [Trichoderma viride]